MQMSTLLFALLAAVVVWTLLVRRLTAKSWIPAGAAGSGGDIGTVPQPAVKVGLWVFLCVITSLFSLFITAYLMRMDPHHGLDWRPFDKPAVLWLNTLFLILGSLSMQWARYAEQQDRIDRLKAGMAIGGFCVLAFLAGQLMAWEQLRHSDSFVMANPAVGFFFLMTAVHGLHLLGGLWVWGGAALRLWRTNIASSGSLTVELCAVYWHYLLLVWMVLFGLLLST